MLLLNSGTEVVLGRRDGCKENFFDVFYNSPVIWVGSLIIAVPEVLICCLVCAHEIQVEHREATNKPNGNECVDDQSNRCRALGHCLPNCYLLCISDLNNAHPAEPEDIKAEQSC
uniref:Uncharacterized protein n=1 Tax=Arundo donax TaxID=35708 RepID=A0A0A9DVX5_ARUDO